jgi:hypothetical protein
VSRPRAARALLALVVLLPTPAALASAQSVERANGEAGAMVLQLTAVPRAAALGGALVASTGVASVFANPAGAITIERLEAHLSGQTLFEGARAGAVAAGLRRRRLSVVLGAQYLDLGSIEEVVCNGCGGSGTPTGRTLGASERAFSLAAALAVGAWASVGLSLHHYATTLAEASGGSLSFSAGARVRLRERLAAGASLQYIGGSAEVGGYAAPLPRTVRLGVEWRPVAPTHPRWHALIAADYATMRGAPGRFGGGLELGIVRSASTVRALGRLGYAPTGGGDFATGALSVGAGLRLRGVSLDYAYQPSDILGGVHRVGITVSRGSGLGVRD